MNVEIPHGTTGICVGGNMYMYVQGYGAEGVSTLTATNQNLR